MGDGWINVPGGWKRRGSSRFVFFHPGVINYFSVKEFCFMSDSLSPLVSVTMGYVFCPSGTLVFLLRKSQESVSETLAIFIHIVKFCTSSWFFKIKSCPVKKHRIPGRFLKLIHGKRDESDLQSNGG